MTRHLILDLETNSKDPNKADLKIFGALDLEIGKYFIIHYKEEMKKYIQEEILNQYDWIITFNGLAYDIPILNRHGFEIPFWKNIDLYVLCKKRNMLIKKDGFTSFSLRNIMEELQLGELKDEIDYNIFLKDDWTQEEIEKITYYTKQDLKITAMLWEFIYKRFLPLAEFIPEKDAKRYKHITTTAGSYAYKVICYMTGLPELYNDSFDEEEYEGAFVSVPSAESVIGLIIDFDFSSLYPMMDIQGNLYSHTCYPECENFKDCTHEKWHGNDDLKVSGYYCKNKQGKVETVLKKLYMLKKLYGDTKDNRREAIKIILNSIYGISGSPRFASLYNINTAGDCTGLGRQCIKYARKKFNEEGFFVIYSDTDSAYVQVPDYKTKEEAEKVAKDIARELSLKMNMPWTEEFDFKTDIIIKYIQFFPTEEGAYKKKLYLFVTEHNELEIKGLQIKKQDCSKLSKELFKRYLKQQIIDNLCCKFDLKYIDEKINELLKEDLTLAAKKWNIREEGGYKSDTSIQMSIQKRYGTGEVRLIRNKKIGIGKGVKYCSLEEAKELNINDIDKKIFYKELAPFIKGNVVQKSQGLNMYGL